MEKIWNSIKKLGELPILEMLKQKMLSICSGIMMLYRYVLQLCQYTRAEI